MNIWSSSIMRMAESAPLANSVVLHVAPLFHVAGLRRAHHRSSWPARPT